MAKASIELILLDDVKLYVITNKSCNLSNSGLLILNIS
uniref:Uncharacterized protein n=1 Tax=Arundo donax TaxID=35708 RepID=A0A0A9A715_ARUDO